MLTNKKRFDRQIQFLLVAVVIAFLAGCTPPGPRALLRGKRLIEEGKFTEAVDELKTATSILPGNAQAWNYLGLAYHHSGEPTKAVDAYQKALRLNPDLIVAHYNLGCVQLEQNRTETLESARNEFTAFTLHQGNSLDGWLKLGTVDLRLNDLYAAENSFKEALRLDPENAEALNDMGMIQLRRRKQRDAATYFNSALKKQPDYAPALLNLASTEVYLGNRTLALQKYREYLAIRPRAANWEAVYNVQLQLDQELNPVRPTNAIAAISNNIVTNTMRNTAVSNTPKPEVVATTSKPYLPPQSTAKPEIVQLTDSPQIKIVDATSSQPVDSSSTAESSETKPGKTDKKGFFQRINPLSLFRQKPKATNVTAVAPLVVPPVSSQPATNESADSTPVVKPTPPAPKPTVIARYPYLAAGQPASGNRSQADTFLARASEAQRNNRAADAVALYRAAAQADPGYFEAELNLGAAAFNFGDLPLSLRAYELALAVKPESFNTRFNFALALKKANYIRDAANELEKLLSTYSSGESPERLAAVHLTLANLYAEQFHQTAVARAHYLKVLELDPHNSQETTIRYWLQDNS